MNEMTDNIIAFFILFGGFVFWPFFRIVNKANRFRGTVLKVIFLSQVVLYSLIALLTVYGALRNPPMNDWQDLIFVFAWIGILSIVCSLLAILLTWSRRRQSQADQ